MKKLFWAGVFFLPLFSLSFWSSSGTLREHRQRKNALDGLSQPARATATVILAGGAWEQDFGRLRRAIELVNATQPELLGGFALFEQNIRETASAADIDFSYGWATWCLARLDRLDECLKYYRIMRERFPGYRQGGASGAWRIWDRRMIEVREIVASSSAPRAKEILEIMIQSEAKVLPSAFPPRDDD